MTETLPLTRRLALALGKRTPVRPVRSRLTRAIASVCFDDVPRSATIAGAKLLECGGFRGSYYVCGAHAGGVFEGTRQHTLADLRRLKRAGHEVASHTFAHQDATLSTPAEWLADHQANEAFLAEALDGERPTTFAYPYGSTSLRSKMFYSRRFLACRGVSTGLNAGLIDLAELRAAPIERRRFDLGRIRDLVAKAADRKGWLIFYTHDVAADPSAYGCRPNDLAATLESLTDAGIEVLPVRDAAHRVLADGA
ncbi:MAG TPA: polysaccharide deacetylase family protein [Caulobacteraceae bacterium]|nr:polysaccharide deacetylase family protein [Caulobacteraceae bacterium]